MNSGLQPSRYVDIRDARVAVTRSAFIQVVELVLIVADQSAKTDKRLAEIGRMASLLTRLKSAPVEQLSIIQELGDIQDCDFWVNCLRNLAEIHYQRKTGIHMNLCDHVELIHAAMALAIMLEASNTETAVGVQ